MAQYKLTTYLLFSKCEQVLQLGLGNRPFEIVDKLDQITKIKTILCYLVQ